MGDSTTDARIHRGEVERMTKYVWAHIHKKVETFQGSDEVQVPELLPGDVYRMTVEDARVLEWKGAATIHTAVIQERATFKRASDLKDGGR